MTPSHLRNTIFVSCLALILFACADESETATTAIPEGEGRPGELKPPEEPRQEAPDYAPADDELRHIYLICDQRDLDHIAPLEDYLFDQGFEVIVAVFEGDEAQVRRDHEENLVTCDAMLYYYGAGNELWLRRKLREALKSAALGRSRPLLSKAIYVAPPETAQKRRLRTREALVIPQQQSFEPASLEPFVRQLR